jgi:hypothetical protein
MTRDIYNSMTPGEQREWVARYDAYNVSMSLGNIKALW